MTRPVTIYWIRRDLRLADNPALREAARRGAVIPLYIDSREEESPWMPGGASLWWLDRSLRHLARELDRRGSTLIVRKGPALAAIKTLAAQSGADAVFWNRLYEPSAMRRDKQLEHELGAAGLSVESFPGHLLYEPAAVSTRQGGPFRVFTPFWKQASSLGHPALPLESPPRIAAPREWPSSLDLAELALAPPMPWHQGLAQAWEPGETAALDSLEQFCGTGLARYGETRDFPGREGISRLSPRLHFGELTPRQVWHAARNQMVHGQDAAGAEPFLRQLGWREFAHHVLCHFPHSSDSPLYEKYRSFPWRKNYSTVLGAWQQGRTGIPIVDAGMRELWHTGWMHNRVRMIAASLLVKNLLVPWWEGARWFWDTLVDADLANNTMGWQWSAGCGADAAPYFRIFNPVLQGEKFDSSGHYVRRWLPELSAVEDKYLHHPWDAPRGAKTGYPEPIVDLARSRRDALQALQAFRDLA